MNKFVVAIIILYSLVYYFFPSQSNIQNTHQTKEFKSTFNIPYENGNIVLKDFKEDDNERYWGTINNYEYMIYKDINKYMYVNGEFYQTKGKWKNGEFIVSEIEALNLFHLEGEKGKYSSKEDGKPNICKNVTKEEVLKILNKPNIPIEHSFITKEEGQLPGASREYRNGHHEGFDWYSGAIGTEISRNTVVNPIFEGRVVRIDKDYKELDPDYRNELLDEAAENKNTSQSTLDKLRGRQLWIQSENGILVHYAHLDSVNETLKIGDKVEVSDWIGKVGNSGTSNGSLGTDEDLHLHSDILVCGKNFWEYDDIKVMNHSLIEIFDQVISNKETTNEEI